MERQWKLVRGRKGQIGFRLDLAAVLSAAQHRIHAVSEVKPEIVDSKPAVQVQPAVQEVNALLYVAGSIGHVGAPLSGQLEGVAADRAREPDVDLVIMKVCTG